MNFKKGEYVVLLSTCNGNDDNWGSSLPVYHCYKLKRDSYEDYRGFMVELDMSGSCDNGWTCSKMYNDVLNKLRFRRATKHEINKYNRINGPFKVDMRIDKLRKISKKINN